MELPSYLISANEDVCLVRLNSGDVGWVVQHTDAGLLENVFSTPGKLSLSEFYTSQFEWTTVYLITDSNSHTFGIIRVVPEMDHVLSLHGIGWPNDYHFSRKYFKAWIGLHQYLFKNQILLRSNCRDDNFGAMNVLLKTGYDASYVNVYFEGERNINFILEAEKFINSPLFLLNHGLEFSSADIDKDRDFKPIKIHSAKPLTKKVNIKLIDLEAYSFKSVYIQNRQEIQVPKKITQIKFQGSVLTVLTLQFDHYRQIHLECSGRMSFLRMMKIKSEWITKLKFTKKDMIFTYFEASNKMLISQLMLGDFTYQGVDLSRSCMIWAVQ